MPQKVFVFFHSTILNYNAYIAVPALRAARTEQPAVAEMPTHSFVQPATRLKP